MSAPSESAWSQPILWLVLGLPALMLVAGFFMLRTAAGLGSTDVTGDRVARTAQVQTTDLAADLAARDRSLSGRLRLVDHVLHLDLATAVIAQPLTLVLQHPIDTRADQTLLLLPAGTGAWKARFDKARAHDWLLRLQPADRAWRLHGRWLRGDSEVELRPSMSAAVDVDVARPTP